MRELGVGILWGCGDVLTLLEVGGRKKLAIGVEIRSEVRWRLDVKGVVGLGGREWLGNGDGLRLFGKLGLRLRVYLDRELLVKH